MCAFAKISRNRDVTYYRDAKEEIPLFRAYQGEVVRDAEFIVTPKKDGKPRIMQASGKAIIGEDGKKLGAVVSMYDITELREATKKLNAADQ